MERGEKKSRSARIFNQSPESWSPTAPLQARHREDVDALLVESLKNLSIERGVELCVKFTRQPWLDKDARALRAANRDWLEARYEGFDLFWWINPAAKIFYCFSNDSDETEKSSSSEVGRILPAITRMLSEELGVTHPMRAVRLAVEALRLQLPEKVADDHTPSHRA